MKWLLSDDIGVSQYTLKNEPKGKGRNRNLVKILKEQIAVGKETIGVKSTYRPSIRPTREQLIDNYNEMYKKLPTTWRQADIQTGSM